MKWARFDQIKPGDVLVTDGGFTCMPEGARVAVEADDKGELFVPCSEGRHYLDGQLDDGEVLIGLIKAGGA